MSTYVIAVKRAMRSEHSVEDAAEIIAAVPEVAQLNSGDNGMLLVDIPAESHLAEIRRQLGEWCHIEPRIDYSPQVFDGAENSFIGFSSDPT